jgi:dolichol-phosphate mannosyltransferase
MVIMMADESDDCRDVVRGSTWKVIPITWRNRRSGVAKLRVREMGNRYFFIMACVSLE